MFDTSMVPPAGGVIDCLVEERPHGTAAPVRWSEYVPDGLLADMLAHPADAGPEHREFESLERIGAWERVIAWAQAGQLRESTPSCAVRTLATLSGCQHVAGAGLGGGRGSLMLRLSAQTAAGRVDDAWALCNRLPASLVALEQGRITLSKARILHAETANLSDAHTAEVEQQVLANAHRQTPEQLRVATRVGWMDARRGDALVDLVLDPTGYCSAGTKAAPGALEACRRRRWR